MKRPFDRILALDFETAWCKKTYTVTNMTTEEYIRDPRFLAWGCSYYWLDELDKKPKWVTHDDLPAFFAGIDWSKTAVLAHNSPFDVGILSWIYGHKPCFIFDTLSMARALYGLEVGNSLAKLAARFNLPAKGAALHSTNGILQGPLPAHIEAELAEYCEHDTGLCVAIFDIVSKGYPVSELRLIDMTVRMFIDPVLELDKELLVSAIHDERIRRVNLLERVGVTEKQLASNDQFALVLRKLGVEPPMKVSKTTGKGTYAFAKSDAHFQSLLSHDNEEVALMCEARLRVRSTLERTRAQRFLDIAGRGTLPVPLSYYAAHTGRWAGAKGSSLNLQNLKRGSFLRAAIMAPEGYTLVVADLSQIEVRVLAWLADYRDMLDIFARGGDPYATFGSRMFGVPGLTQETHPELRQSAKSALLGCGYGLGWASFAGQLLTGFLGAPPVLYGPSFAKQLGMRALDVERFMQDPVNVTKMTTIPHSCTNDELVVHCAVTNRLVNQYRATAGPVVKLWRLCDDFISKCLVTDDAAAKFGGGQVRMHKCLTFQPGAVRLPSGLHLRYPDLKGIADENGRVQWTYDTHKGRTKLYGGKLTENIVQAVARVVMSDGMLRIQQHYPCRLTCHDEVVVMVPEEEAENAATWIKSQMVVDPKYMPGIPLQVKVGIGKRYGDAK